MRVLLDESLPRQLKDNLSGHQVRTVPKVDWAGKKNGELLRLAQQQFDVFVTPDAQLPNQRE
jgi:predicted nuclease of predicted toxin-antitoxin system